MTPLRIIAALPVLAALTACSTMPSTRCAAGQDAAVQELLYFGTEKPGGHVGAEEWARFLAEVVTPRFPDGLTAWQASGQWRSESGALVHEPSYVVSLVHPRDAATERAVRDIVEAYKTTFEQEAVLRVATSACMSL